MIDGFAVIMIAFSIKRNERIARIDLRMKYFQRDGADTEAKQENKRCEKRQRWVERRHVASDMEIEQLFEHVIESICSVITSTT